MWEKESREMNWREGMEYAKNLSLGGYDDWRLPTIEELREVVTLCGGVIVEYKDDDMNAKLDKNIDNKIYQANYKAQGFASSNYWSSTEVVAYVVQYVSFYSGGASSTVELDSCFIRCVRAGQ